MAARCLLYYITDRIAFAGDEPSRRRLLLEKISEAARAGIDYIQLREKDLSTRELESLARESFRTIRDAGNSSTSLLINSRLDVALAVQADGVHLRSNDISPREVNAIWQRSANVEKLSMDGLSGASASVRRISPLAPLIGVSCHAPAEVLNAEENGATFAVFAPVFEKKDIPFTQPTGLARLRQACQTSIPVLALGGITFSNARSCLQAGAAGIAAIRLFQENDVEAVVRQLRSL